jgi:hypothetical protein
MVTVFTSYETTTGMEFAKHLQKALRKHDISSFVASVDIPFGEDPSQSINSNLRECKFFVPILTITALKSEEVRKEFLLAKEMGKHIIPCIKEGLENRLEKDFKEILNSQYATFETKEDLANTVVETVLKGEISDYKNSLRRLKEPITRSELVDGLLYELISVRHEIYFWLSEPDVDPNKEYIFRRPIEAVEKEKNEELQKIKKEIVDSGFPLMA